MPYFCVSVTFLDPQPSFHGRGDAGKPEWPPSPLRVFQALVAAAAAHWRESQFWEYAKPALGWLEQQPAPTILAPSGHVGIPVRLAVPNNDLDVVATAWSRGQEPKKQPSELKTMKTVRQTRRQRCSLPLPPHQRLSAPRRTCRCRPKYHPPRLGGGYGCSRCHCHLRRRYYQIAW